MLDSDHQTAGDKLLRLFDRDRVIAEQKLLRCKEKLVRRFAAERCYDAEDLASETLRRVLKTLNRDETQLTTTIEAYISGFATRIIHESHRRPILKEVPLDELPSATEPRSLTLEEFELAFSKDEDLRSCLKQCLDELSQTDRETLLAYYNTELDHKLKHVREQMARSMHLSSSQLRKRTFNLRAALEACIQDCLALRNKIQKSS
jgi:DNA-directed RNA polymerase specialized sigma24 family protein